jgi:hypothetical protein
MFEIELAGLLPGEFDALLVQGGVTLDGTLDVGLLSGFLPRLGDIFTIIDNQGTNAVSGMFSQGSLIGAGGYLFGINYGGGDGNDVVLFTLSGLDGDYNNDGVVDAADYTVWRDNLGAAAGTLLNDPDGIAIGTAQYATWKRNFGATLTSPISVGRAAVPEPSTGVLVVLFALAMAYRYRMASH